MKKHEQVELINQYLPDGFTAQIEKYQFYGMKQSSIFVRGGESPKYQTLCLSCDDRKFNAFACPKGFLGNPNETWPLQKFQGRLLNKINFEKLLKYTKFM